MSGARKCRLLHAARRRDQKRRRKTLGQIAIKHGPHSSGEFQAADEILVQAPPADNVKRLVADRALAVWRKD